MKPKNIFNGVAACLLTVAALLSCQKGEEVNTLSVSPSAIIEFASAGNDDVVLSVTTDASSWEFTVPEWIDATKGEKTLVVNAKNNETSEELVGRIVITAGNAEPVKIIVTQAPAGGQEVTDGAKGKFYCTDASASIFIGSETAVSANVNVAFESAVTGDVTLSVSVDADYLAEYNYLNKESYELFPAGKIAMDGELAVKAGEKESNTLEISLDGSELDFGTGYLVPLIVKVESGAATIKGDDRRVNLIVMRKNPKPVRNVLYFEVNDTNPLNALEYKMSDGSYFFDAVILFAANINYNSSDDVVYLHNNPNVQALLNETDVYLQPLRKAGIKVYLGLLGNHDASGLCQLSDWGAKEWAKEVAQACREYKLDGVSLDDEYSGYPDTGNKWFTSPSAAAGSRLCYELKKAMKKECSWPTEVSYFAWGSLNRCSNVVDSETNETHTPAEFIDFYVANYGGASSPYSDLTYANCSFASIECNLGSGSISESSARSAKEKGYGWCMWFAFDPSGSGGIDANYNRVKSYMRAFAKGCYDLDLVEPTGVYHKIGEGKYDPKRYDL